VVVNEMIAAKVVDVDVVARVVVNEVVVAISAKSEVPRGKGSRRKSKRRSSTPRVPRREISVRLESFCSVP